MQAVSFSMHLAHLIWHRSHAGFPSSNQRSLHSQSGVDNLLEGSAQLVQLSDYPTQDKH